MERKIQKPFPPVAPRRETTPLENEWAIAICQNEGCLHGRQLAPLEHAPDAPLNEIAPTYWIFDVDPSDEQFFGIDESETPTVSVLFIASHKGVHQM
jgi:hypothetical protein